MDWGPLFGVIAGVVIVTGALVDDYLTARQQRNSDPLAEEKVQCPHCERQNSFVRLDIIASVQGQGSATVEGELFPCVGCGKPLWSTLIQNRWMKRYLHRFYPSLPVRTKQWKARARR